MWLVVYEYTIFKEGREDIGSSGYTVVGVYDTPTYTEQAVKRTLDNADMKVDARVRIGKKETHTYLTTDEYYDEVNDIVCQEIKNVKVRKVTINEDY